jgi:hypothetical protein
MKKFGVAEAVKKFKVKIVEKFSSLIAEKVEVLMATFYKYLSRIATSSLHHLTKIVIPSFYSKILHTKYL